MKPQFCHFSPPDRPGLIKAIDAVCGEERWMRTPRFQPTPTWAHALDEPGCPHHLLLVAKDMDHVIGWCRLFPQDASAATLGVGLLALYRDQGIGTGLVHQALQWAWSTGLERVGLTTRTDNARAIRVFTRCGFHVTGRSHNGSLEMAQKRPSHSRGECTYD
jgi:RimJ/RimL family protein N-acetyltransferase